jgi:predicted phosphodiesterase
MVQKDSRVAAIYDVHGNLPALEAILADLQRVNPDLVVVGGDVVPGPMPVEVLDRLAALGERVCFVRGNADREVVAAYDDGRYADAIDVSDPAEHVAAYTASKIDRRHRDLLASFAERLVIGVEGLGQDLFCHGSPRRDEEIVTAATSEGRLRGILVGVDQDLLVCEHTHTQFDRRVDGKVARPGLVARAGDRRLLTGAASPARIFLLPLLGVPSRANRINCREDHFYWLK